MRYFVAAVVAVALAGCSSPAPRVAPLPTERDSYQAALPAAPAELRGAASWYGQPGTSRPAVAWYTRPNKFGKPFRFYAAAGPALRAFLGKPNSHFYQVHYRVEVCTTGRPELTCIVADVVDWCACSKGRRSEKAIDLSPAAFQALGVSLERGVQRVVIRRIP